MGKFKDQMIMDEAALLDRLERLVRLEAQIIQVRELIKEKKSIVRELQLSGFNSYIWGDLKFKMEDSEIIISDAPKKACEREGH